VIDAQLFQNTNANFLTTKSGVGMWIFLPDALAANRERRIGGSTPITLASGTITHDGVAYSANLASGGQYEIHAIQPKLSFDILTMTMREFVQPDYMPLHGGNDEDMEATGTTNYAVSGAGSISKVTAAGNVESGASSLFFNAGTANEVMSGPDYTVVGSKQYFASACYRVDAGGPVYFYPYDVTNSAEIESANRRSHALERFLVVQRRFTTPATCEHVDLRVEVTGSADDAYIDYLCPPRKSTDSYLYLPASITRDSQVRKLYVATYSEQVSADVYDARSRQYEEWGQKGVHWNTRFNPHHANPGRIEFPKGSPPLEELWIEAVRKSSDITTWAFTAAGETAPTTSIDRHMLALAWVKNVCKAILTYAPDDQEVQATLEQIAGKGGEKGELTYLMEEYMRDLETPYYAPAHPLSGRSMTGLY
jgi:hypothetical protein